MSAWLAERMDATPGQRWAVVGVRSRGDELARRMVEQLGEDRLVGPVGALDVTLYRDDLTEISPQPVVGVTEVPFDLDGVQLVLVDDVMMTGRSIRAALQALLDFGRPARIWLAVLADRGGRELPIHPDFAAIDMRETPGDDRLKLLIRPAHDRDALLAVPHPTHGAA